MAERVLATIRISSKSPVHHIIPRAESEITNPQICQSLMVESNTILYK